MYRLLSEDGERQIWPEPNSDKRCCSRTLDTSCNPAKNKWRSFMSGNLSGTDCTNIVLQAKEKT